MLYNYSVTPLKEDHFEERCKDIVELVKTNVISMPLFCMTLVPEGNPVIDKVGKMVKIYARYRDELEKSGVSCGILVQASLGHGYDIIPNPFQKYVNLTDGKEEFVCCPEDEKFVEHFCSVMKTLAEQRPAAIMLDDDFRLMMRPGMGCTCPLHMKEFNRRTGLNYTREELSEHIFEKGIDDSLTDVFRDIQRDSLINFAKALREVIDSVDPSIQGVNCTSGYLCESVDYTNKIFAGKGNPTIVRVPNGSYAPSGIRGFSDLMSRGVICGSKLKKAGIDYVLAETDTIPFNRYAKSAAYLHAHYTVSVLDGLLGAKHWLSRTTAFEIESGRAYRNILAKNYGLYEKLAEIAKEIRWTGCCQAYKEQDKYFFDIKKKKRYNIACWMTKTIERLGIPFYFSDEGGNAVFLEDKIASYMSDEEIKKVFEGSVFMDSVAAEDLIKRGYGDLLGVDVNEWDLGLVSFELIDEKNECCCTKQKNLKKLTIVKDEVEAVSYNCINKGGKLENLAPAVTVYRRDNGKITVVYCGSPDVEFNYMEGFSFLNESRKKQFVNLLKEADALPVYCVGDDEICLRAGYVSDDRMLVAAFKLGLDVLDSVKIYLEKRPEKICMLDSDGNEVLVEFEDLGDNVYEVKQKVETLYPLILLIK